MNNWHCHKLLLSFLMTIWCCHKSINTSHQQRIGIAKICVSNSGAVVWIQQWTWKWMNLICEEVCAPLPPSGRCCTSCLIAEELHSNIGWSLSLLQSEQRFEIGYHWNPSLLLISNEQMQQPTEMWKKTAQGRIKLCQNWISIAKNGQLNMTKIIWDPFCWFGIATSQLTEISCSWSLFGIAISQLIHCWRWMQQPTWTWQKTSLAKFDLVSEMQLAHFLSSLISLCWSPFGIATSQSTHCQQTISFAASCLSNTEKLVVSPQICGQIKVTMRIYLPPNLLNEFIVDNRLPFHLWR